MEQVITKEMLAAARLCGACREGLSRYSEGQSISTVHWLHLAWASEMMPVEAHAIAVQMNAGVPGVISGVVPLEFFGYGDGDGSGYGYGDGYAR